MSHYRQAVQMLTGWRCKPTKASCFGQRLDRHLRRQSVILPALSTPSSEGECRRSPVLTGASTTPLGRTAADARIAAASRRSCSSAGTTARRLWLAVCADLQPSQIRGICWNIRTPQAWRALTILPTGIRQLVRRTACSGIARGRPDDTRRHGQKFEAATALRRFLGALAAEGMATVTDEIIDLRPHHG